MFFSSIVSFYVHYQLSYFHQFWRYWFVISNLAISLECHILYITWEQEHTITVFFKIYFITIMIFKVDILRKAYLWMKSFLLTVWLAITLLLKYLYYLIVFLGGGVFSLYFIIIIVLKMILLFKVLLFSLQCSPFSGLPVLIHQSFQIPFKISLSPGISPSTELSTLVSAVLGLGTGEALWRRGHLSWEGFE